MRTFSYCSTPASRLGKSLSTGSHRKPRVSALGLGELKVGRSLTILWSGGGHPPARAADRGGRWWDP